MVFGFNGIGLGETAAMVFQRGAEGLPKLMGLGATSECGEYTLRFSATGEEEAYCCFFKDGFEPCFQELCGLGTKKQMNVDVILHDAIPMSFHVKNRLGFPLGSLGLRIDTRNEGSYPISYITGRDGIARTQAIFREGGHYQVTVLAGGTALCSENFVANKCQTMEIRIPMTRQGSPSLSGSVKG